MSEKKLSSRLKKSENLSKWYTQVISRSELADYAPVKGCIVFREYSYGIWERIQKSLDEMLKKSGHKNAYFPIFIPESLLKKEAEHFEGFVPECAWVTIGGSSKLSERLAIRPTSETIIYAMYKKWVKSWRDLPIKLNQWCNIVRWETKATKPFLRTKEFLWQEGHTAHATKEEADEEVMEIAEIYRRLVEEYLAIPTMVGRKSEEEKFAGALYTATLESLMPDGRALQMGTSHQLGQNFSRPFEIQFVGKDEEKHFVWQTSWGVSTRLIGALIMVHGDDRGLIIPPRVAPYQVVIIPIYYKGSEKRRVLDKAKEVSDKLEGEGFNVSVDDREERTPGWKFNEWELKGVPLRVEIGPKDIQGKRLTLVRRDNFERTSVEERRFIERVGETLDDIQKNLFERAKRFMEENTTTVETYEDFKATLERRGGFIRACWCSRQECERKINEETGATIRLIPFEREDVFSNCVYCNEKADEVAYFAKAY
ncbi:MAG: proline--tRNA ligase [Candidatus Geothermarchaeales archaeon]